MMRIVPVIDIFPPCHPTPLCRRWNVNRVEGFDSSYRRRWHRNQQQRQQQEGFFFSMGKSIVKIPSFLCLRSFWTSSHCQHWSWSVKNGILTMTGFMDSHSFSPRDRGFARRLHRCVYTTEILHFPHPSRRHECNLQLLCCFAQQLMHVLGKRWLFEDFRLDASPATTFSVCISRHPEWKPCNIVIDSVRA